MKKLIFTVIVLSILTTFAACKKEVPASNPASPEAKPAALKAEDTAAPKADDAKSDDAKPDDAKPENAKADDAKADDAKADDAKADDAKAEDNNEGNAMDKPVLNPTKLAIDICKIGDLPDDPSFKGDNAFKKAVADCKAGKGGKLNLTLGQTYEFQQAISWMNIDWGEFPKKDKIEDTIKEVLSMMQYEAVDVKIEDATELSKKHGIAIKKVTYRVGGNEDTVFHEDYYYTSGEHDYGFEIAIHEGDLDELKDKILNNMIFE